MFQGIQKSQGKMELELHNRWNMELNTEGLLGYQELEAGLGQSEAGYYWISRMNLKNTWEDVILLLVPMYTDTGEFLGSLWDRTECRSFQPGISRLQPVPMVP